MKLFKNSKGTHLEARICLIPSNRLKKVLKRIIATFENLKARLKMKKGSCRLLLGKFFFKVYSSHTFSSLVFNAVFFSIRNAREEKEAKISRLNTIIDNTVGERTKVQ